jgi:riboflavin-specific deaminase-like protein
MKLAERPHVTLHYAQSIDGRIGLPGQRTPLSSRAGFALAHRARAENDAVLVGRMTVQIDDPQLAAPPDGPQPRRIVLASSLAVPAAARMLRGGPGTLVLGVRGRASERDAARLAEAGARVQLVEADASGWVSLPEALSIIGAWGVRKLLVEGGASVLGSFLRMRLADEATVEIAPRLLGAPGVQSVGALDGGARLDDLRVERADESVVLRGRVVY